MMGPYVVSHGIAGGGSGIPAAFYIFVNWNQGPLKIKSTAENEGKLNII